jgi:hypothetical protein
MSVLAELSEQELARAFEAGRVPDGDFTHRGHVRVAWELLRRCPLGLALDQVIHGSQTLARHRGLPDLYHATITTFYVLAIADRLARGDDVDGFEAFAVAHPELLGPSRDFLLGYYRAETLDAGAARQRFFLPERLP